MGVSVFVIVFLSISSFIVTWGAALMLLTRKMLLYIFFIDIFALTFFWLTADCSLSYVFSGCLFHMKWSSLAKDWHRQLSLWNAHLQIIVIPLPGSHLHSHFPINTHKHTNVLFFAAHLPIIIQAYNTWGQAKSSIIALAHAPLVKGEQYVKWLILLSSAEFCAILVTGKRKGCRRGK